MPQCGSGKGGRYRLRKLSSVTTSAPLFPPSFSEADLPGAASAGLMAGAIGAGTTVDVDEGIGTTAGAGAASGCSDGANSSAKLSEGSAKLRTAANGTVSR